MVRRTVNRVIMLFNSIRFDAIRCGLFCFGLREPARLTNPSESGISIFILKIKKFWCVT